MFIKSKVVNPYPFKEYIKELSSISYNELYEITEIKRKSNCSGVFECTTDNLCIRIKGDNIKTILCLSNLICYGFPLANKLGQKLKSRKYTYRFI